MSTPWRRSHPGAVVLAVALAALVAVVVPAAVAGGGRSTCAATTVKVTDHMKFVINQYAQDAMRFSPGTVTVAPACSLTFEFATSGMKESHSLTIVKQSDLPTTAAQMENCKICQQIVAKHITHPGQPPGPTNPIAHWFVNVGRPGLDAPGDSIAIAEGKGTPPGHTRVTTPVSAPKGTILYFMCGLHPWMQGKIVVK